MIRKTNSRAPESIASGPSLEFSGIRIIQKRLAEEPRKIRNGAFFKRTRKMNHVDYSLTERLDDGRFRCKLCDGVYKHLKSFQRHRQPTQFGPLPNLGRKKSLKMQIGSYIFYLICLFFFEIQCSGLLENGGRCNFCPHLIECSCTDYGGGSVRACKHTHAYYIAKMQQQCTVAVLEENCNVQDISIPENEPDLIPALKSKMKLLTQKFNV